MRDLRLLTPDAVTDLAGAGELCTFWQTVPHNGHVASQEPLEVTSAWVREVTADWGPPGRVAYVDGRPVGYVLLAPARLVPRLAAFATAPSDPATLMLLTVNVETDQLGHGLRKALVQAAVKMALHHRVRSIEAIAARPTVLTRDPCVLEASFLEKVGFRVTRDHPLYPRLRLDLRTVVTIRDEATAAVQRALARVSRLRPVPETHPDGATRARAADRRPG